MILRKLKIGARLAIGFGAVMVLLAGAAVGSVILDKLNRDRLTATLAAASAKEQLAVEMKLVALEQSSALRNLVLITDLKGMAAENDRIKSLAASTRCASAWASCSFPATSARSSPRSPASTPSSTRP